MKRRRLVVISLDSMGFRDLNELRELTPNLARLIEQGTWVKKSSWHLSDLDLSIAHIDHYWPISGSSWNRQQYQAAADQAVARLVLVSAKRNQGCNAL